MSNDLLEERLIQYLYNLMQFLSNLSKIIPSQKTADIILQILTSLDFLQQVKVKISKKLTEIIKIKSKNS